MESTETDIEVREKSIRAMHEAVGACLMAWASVENALAFMFIHHCGIPTQQANKLLLIPKSFEMKFQTICSQMPFVPMTGDRSLAWSVLPEHIRNLSKKRNEIAHSTLVTDDKHKASLETYFQWLGVTKTIDLQEVIATRDLFLEAAHSITWLSFRLPETAERLDRVSIVPTPGLIHRLRAEKEKLSEAQRLRQKSPHQ